MRDTLTTFAELAAFALIVAGVGLYDKRAGMIAAGAAVLCVCYLLARRSA